MTREKIKYGLIRYFYDFVFLVSSGKGMITHTEWGQDQIQIRINIKQKGKDDKPLSFNPKT